eukprot:31467-Pelagococcus_subviridis.AAC.3
MRRAKSLRIGVHLANAVVWEPVYRTHRTRRRRQRGRRRRPREGRHEHARAVDHRDGRGEGDVHVLRVGVGFDRAGGGDDAKKRRVVVVPLDVDDALFDAVRAFALEVPVHVPARPDLDARAGDAAARRAAAAAATTARGAVVFVFVVVFGDVVFRVVVGVGRLGDDHREKIRVFRPREPRHGNADALARELEPAAQEAVPLEEDDLVRDRGGEERAARLPRERRSRRGRRAAAAAAAGGQRRLRLLPRGVQLEILPSPHLHLRRRDGGVGAVAVAVAGASERHGREELPVAAPAQRSAVARERRRRRLLAAAAAAACVGEAIGQSNVSPVKR